MDTLPQDPFMLYSAINMKLRDYYTSLDMLCDHLGLDKNDIICRLASAGFSYNPEQNRFR